MHTLQDWPRNEAFLFEMPVSLMTMSNNEIADTILRIYREWRLIYNPTEYFPWGELAHGIDWKWYDKAKVALPRRLANLLYKYKFKFPIKFWGELGNMLRERIPVTHKVVIRIANQFNWKRGMFGDGGSCMWDGRAHIRTAMAQQGKFLALQMFSPELMWAKDDTMVVTVDGKEYYSQARCWLHPTDVTIGGQDEYIVAAFNSYGGIPLSTMALVIQGLIEADGYKQISISNNDRTSGGVYVNGGQGRLIGSEAALKAIGHLDFSFKNNYDSQGGQRRAHNTARTATGAIINPEYGGLAKRDKKPRRFNAYRMQKSTREYIEGNFHSSSLNKYAKKSKSSSISDRWIMMIDGRVHKSKPEAPKAYISKREYMRMKLKGIQNYRGTTRAEMTMFDTNGHRLRNLTGWGSLESEFPRWNLASRQRFIKSVTSHGYNFWSYVTFILSKTIKEV